MIPLAVVRIWEHTLRGAREVAFETGRQARSCFIGAAALGQIAVEPVAGVAQFDGNRVPFAADDQAAGDQFAALANATAG